MPSLLAAIFIGAWALGAPIGQADEPAQIQEAIRGLRKLADADRAVATGKLALRIRALSAGDAKLRLAEGLTSRATEGDFGRDTLQSVTDTLAQAVAERPEPRQQDGRPGFAYLALAELMRYEGMKVTLDAADFKAALAVVDRTDSVRARADFSLKDLDGKTWTLSALKGKVVLVNFWATWCPPCRKEMPDLEALYQRFKSQGFVILAISDEEDAKVRPFIAEKGYTYPVLLDPGDVVEKRYLIEGIPKSFVVDRKGKMVAQSIDMRTQEQFLKMLEKAGLR